MNRYVFFAALLSSTFGCSDGQTDAGPVLLIENAAVLSWEAGSFIEGQDLVIEGERIVAVSDHGTLDVDETLRYDGTDQYVIPGLWDMHVHFAYDLELQPAMLDLFLANGITGVRDTGGHLDLLKPMLEVARQTDEPRTDVYFAGPLLDGVPHVYDGSAGRPDLSVGLGSEAEARAAVDSLAASGVHLLKSYEMLTPAIFSAILDQASQRGLKVTGHVPLSMHAEGAAQAGLYSMEHMRNLETSCSSKKEALYEMRQDMLENGADQLGGALRSAIHTAIRSEAIPTQDEDVCSNLLAVLAEHKTWQIPTLTIVAARKNRLYAETSWRETFNYLPTSLAGKWEENAIRFSLVPANEQGVAFGEWGFSMVGQLHDANVPLLAGTDTPIFFLTPGFSLHKELEFLVQGGMSPLEAIWAATRGPAEYFELSDDRGSLEPGMLADLVLLNDNPLDEISNTNRIEAVLRKGTLLDREALDRLLERASQY